MNGVGTIPAAEEDHTLYQPMAPSPATTEQIARPHNAEPRSGEDAWFSFVHSGEGAPQQGKGDRFSSGMFFQEGTAADSGTRTSMAEAPRKDHSERSSGVHGVGPHSNPPVSTGALSSSFTRMPMVLPREDPKIPPPRHQKGGLPHAHFLENEDPPTTRSTDINTIGALSSATAEPYSSTGFSTTEDVSLERSGEFILPPQNVLATYHTERTDSHVSSTPSGRRRPSRRQRPPGIIGGGGPASAATSAASTAATSATTASAASTPAALRAQRVMVAPESNNPVTSSAIPWAPSASSNRLVPPPASGTQRTGGVAAPRRRPTGGGGGPDTTTSARTTSSTTGENVSGTFSEIWGSHAQFTAGGFMGGPPSSVGGNTSRETTMERSGEFVPPTEHQLESARAQLAAEQTPTGGADMRPETTMQDVFTVAGASKPASELLSSYQVPPKGAASSKVADLHLLQTTGSTPAAAPKQRSSWVVVGKAPGLPASTFAPRGELEQGEEEDTTGLAATLTFGDAVPRNKYSGGTPRTPVAAAGSKAVGGSTPGYHPPGGGPPSTKQNDTQNLKHQRRGKAGHFSVQPQPQLEKRMLSVTARTMSSSGSADGTTTSSAMYGTIGGSSAGLTSSENAGAAPRLGFAVEVSQQIRQLSSLSAEQRSNLLSFDSSSAAQSPAVADHHAVSSPASLEHWSSAGSKFPDHQESAGSLSSSHDRVGGMAGAREGGKHHLQGVPSSNGGGGAATPGSSTGGGTTPSSIIPSGLSATAPPRTSSVAAEGGPHHHHHAHHHHAKKHRGAGLPSAVLERNTPGSSNIVSGTYGTSSSGGGQHKSGGSASSSSGYKSDVFSPKVIFVSKSPRGFPCICYSIFVVYLMSDSVFM